MLRSPFMLVAGTVVSAGLMIAAVVLWTHTLIIFAAPLGVASVAAAWVAIDNVFIYQPKEQAPPAQVESAQEGPGA